MLKLVGKILARKLGGGGGLIFTFKLLLVVKQLSYGHLAVCISSPLDLHPLFCT